MFIFKVILGICIIGITTYLGYLKSKKLHDREYILREMIVFLNDIENEIKYNLSILPNAIESARLRLTTSLKNVLGVISLEMVKCEDLDCVDKCIVENISKIEGLESYDKSVFISTLKNLGRSNVESQINIIQNTINVIKNLVNEANEIKLKSSKMYRTIGTISGLIIVVLFI